MENNKEKIKKIIIKQGYEYNKIEKFLHLKKRNFFFIDIVKSNNKVKKLFAIEKKHHNKRGPEYIILKKHWINHYHKNQKFLIPQPYGWIPEQKVLIVKKAEGRLLSNMLMFFLLPGISFFAVNHIYKNLALAVDWLIDFQKYTLQNEPFDFINLFEETKERITILSEEWKHITESIFKAIDYQTICHLTIPQVDWHGDFLHRNILIKNNTVTVIDWEGHWKFDSLHPLFELYRFIFNLLFLSKGKPIYSLKKLKKISRWIFCYYTNKIYFPLKHEDYKAVYYLFLIFLIYNYDKQIRGLSLIQSRRNTELMKNISEIPFEELFYEKD